MIWTDLLALQASSSSAGEEALAAELGVHEGASKWLFIAPASIYLIVFFAFPIVRNVLTKSAELHDQLCCTPAGLRTTDSRLPSNLPLGNLRRAADEHRCLHIGSIVGQFAIGLGLAVFFSRRFPLNGVIRSLLLLPWLLPLVVSSTVWRWMLDQDDGIVNSILLHAHLTSSTVPWLTSTHVSLISVIIVNIWIGIPVQHGDPPISGLQHTR